MIGILINYLTQKFQTFNYLQSVYGLAGFEDGDNKFLWVYQNTEKVLLNLDMHQSCSLFLTNGKVDTTQEESQLVANEYNVVKKYPFKALVYIQGNEDVNCITESQKIADSIQKSITGRQKQILASTQLTDAYIEVTGTNFVKEEIYKQYYSNGGLQEKDILVEIEFDFVISGNQDCFVDSPCSDDEYIFSFDAPQTFCERVDACLDIPTANGNYVLKILNGVKSWIAATAGATWGSITGTLSAQTDLQNALNAKEDTITAGTTSQYWRGDKSWQTLNKSAVGLGNVDNTSDADKPVSNATQQALDQEAITRLNADNALSSDILAEASARSSADTNILSFVAATYATLASLTSYLTTAAAATTYQVILSAANFGAFINGLTDKTTPVDADAVSLMDSADSNNAKKLTWANIKATLKSYFDTLYATTAYADKKRAYLYFSANSISPADSTTYYISFVNNVTKTGTAGAGAGKSLQLGYAAKIVGGAVTVANTTTQGSSEDSTLLIRNVTTSTSSSIGTFKTNAAVDSNNSFISKTITGASIDVAATDEIALQWNTPTYATNPADTRIYGYLIVEF